MTSHKRINTTEWRKATELTIARGAPCVSLHAQDMLALLDELDATHEARKEAQVGVVGLHKRMNDSVHQVRIDMRKHIKAAEDDAARYRWLRGKAGIGGLGENLTLSFPRVPAKITDMSFEHDVDRAIHYAMLAAAPKPDPATCTCPSGDGSLRWPCPTHPPESVA